MSQASPLARVKEEFGGKDKLVDKIVGLLGSEADESKDDLRKRLLGAANKKLIRLHQIAAAVKQHGGHDQLVSATAAGLGRTKDKDYVQKLEAFSNGRLLDMLTAAEKRGKRAGTTATMPGDAPVKAKAPRAPRPAAAKSAPATKATKATKKSKAASGKNA